MAVEGCGKFIKYSMFIVNLLIFVGGLAILALGSWIIADGGAKVQEVLGDKMYINSAAILLTFGGIVAFVSFLGCCGAIKEVKCLLLVFFIIMLLLTIVIILGVVFAFKIKNKARDLFDEGLEGTLKEYNSDPDLKKSWDYIQTELKCCGAKNMSDWGTAVPDSCNCKPENEPKICSKTYPYYWNQPCSGELINLIEKHAQPLAIVGILTSLVIILAMIFSCTLFLQI